MARWYFGPRPTTRRAVCDADTAETITCLYGVKASCSSCRSLGEGHAVWTSLVFDGSNGWKSQTPASPPPTHGRARVARREVCDTRPRLVEHVPRRKP